MGLPHLKPPRVLWFSTNPYISDNAIECNKTQGLNQIAQQSYRDSRKTCINSAYALLTGFLIKSHGTGHIHALPEVK